MTAFLGALEAPDSSVREVRALLEHWRAGARGPRAGVGCLLCNTASERAATDVKSRRRVRAYVNRIRATLGHALSNAQAAGVLAADVDVEAQASFFASHAIGQLTLIRSRAAPEVVEIAADVAQAHLEALLA